MSLTRLLFRVSLCGMAASVVAYFGISAYAQERLLRATLGAPTPLVTDEQAPASKEAEPKAETKVPEQPKSAWYTHPVPQTFARPGNFSILPKGPGYYSLQDVVRGEYRDGPPKSAWPAFAIMPPSFFNADFRYVDDPKQNPDFWERMHRIHLGDNWLFGTGGQAWWRHMHETNSRLSGRNNVYDLWRIRQYGDLWYRDTFRIYAEFISANTVSQDLLPLRIDEDRADLQNLFFDLKIGEYDCHPIYMRVGRQELLYGSQRMISPPDWANVRRTFQGVRTFWSNDKFDVDLFYAQPVIPDNTEFNSVDHKQNFYGAWFTYRPEKGHFMDLYYLFLDNSNTTTTQGINIAPTRVHTLGTRYTGDRDGFLWDAEAALQLGQRGPADILAGMATAGLGYNFKCAPMNPTIWAYYDWASGDGTPNTGDYNTYNQLFPFGHYYLGWIDLVGRQNIRDWNFHLYLYPAKWITVNAQWHFFALDKSRDALYNEASAPSRVRLNGSAGGVVGQEMDIILNFHITKHSDILTGYSRLNSGNFIGNTGNGRSPELWYLMYNVRW